MFVVAVLKIGTGHSDDASHRQRTELGQLACQGATILWLVLGHFFSVTRHFHQRHARMARSHSTFCWTNRFRAAAFSCNKTKFTSCHGYFCSGKHDQQLHSAQA